MKPYYECSDVTLYQGDSLAALRELPSDSVHTVVTSPPYWQLRDYGTDGQIGLEGTPEQYVESLVAVFAEVRRVLRGDGVVFLNIGDSYFTRSIRREQGNRDTIAAIAGEQQPSWREFAANGRAKYSSGHPTLKDKDLCLIPERLAIALQSDGWYVRSRIAWCKRACMPESVTDRPTSAWEHIFLLAKSAEYYFDAEAIKEPSIHEGRIVRATGVRGKVNGDNKTVNDRRTALGFTEHDSVVGSGRNSRNFWLLSPEPMRSVGAVSYDRHRITSPDCSIHGCRESQRSAPECGEPLDASQIDRNPHSDADRVLAQVGDSCAKDGCHLSSPSDVSSATRHNTQSHRTEGESSPVDLVSAQSPSGIVCSEPPFVSSCEPLHTCESNSAVDAAQGASGSDPSAQTAYDRLRNSTRHEGPAAETSDRASIACDVESHSRVSSTGVDYEADDPCGQKDAGRKGMYTSEPSEHQDGCTCTYTTIAVKGQDHYAVYPTEIPRRAILAGTSEAGCCSKCLAPYERVTEKDAFDSERPQTRRALEIARRAGLTEQHIAAIRAFGMSDAGAAKACQSGADKNTEEVKRLAGEAKVVLGGYFREFLFGQRSTKGWQPTCSCNAGIRPCVVLDPFVGSGTTAVVARQLGRHAVGIDLSETYLSTIAIPRLEATTPNLFAQPAEPEPSESAEQMALEV